MRLKNVRKKTMEKITLTSSLQGVRIDAYISQELADFSRNTVTRLIEDGAVTVNGKSVKKNRKVNLGDRVEITVPEPTEPGILPQNIPLDVVFEDDCLLVVNKPKGMVVHPAAGNWDGTLVNALLYRCKGELSGINGVMRPGIVHRIDKDTSGLLIVAKTDFAHRILASQIKEHSFTREYEAVALGNLKEDSGTINAPIGRHPVKRKQMAVTYKNSKNAVTHWSVIARYSGYTHIKLQLETGRTHQIRVHLSSVGHPIAGDTVYGGEKNTCGLQGQCLHARKIGFVHPKTGEYMCFTSDLPQYFTDFLSRLGDKVY